MADTSRATGTLTIDIVESCITVTDDHEIDIEIDGDISCFVPGQSIPLRIYPTPDTLSFTVKNTFGSVVADSGSNGTSVHEEYIEVKDGAATTEYPIYSVDSISWHGNDAPCSTANITWTKGYKYLRCTDGSCTGSPDDTGTAGICDITWGVLKVNYRAFYKGYVANATEAGKIIIYAYENI